MDHGRLTQVGRAPQKLGIELPQELRLRGIRSVAEANRFLRDSYVAEFTQQFRVPAAQRGTAFVPAPQRELERIFSISARSTRTIPWSWGSGSCRSKRPAGARTWPVAGCWFANTSTGSSLFATDRTKRRASRPPVRRRRRLEPRTVEERTAGNRGKVQKTLDFSTVPTALRNPAHPAGFPLSHSPKTAVLLFRTAQSKTSHRTDRVLTKPVILTCQRHSFDRWPLRGNSMPEGRRRNECTESQCRRRPAPADPRKHEVEPARASALPWWPTATSDIGPWCAGSASLLRRLTPRADEEPLPAKQPISRMPIGQFLSSAPFLQRTARVTVLLAKPFCIKTKGTCWPG